MTEQGILEALERGRRKPPRFTAPRIDMSHGAGGKATHKLIEGLILPEFDNPGLAPLSDAGLVPWGGAKLALTTDSFVVRPLLFPGGSIGELAVNGTVNDLLVAGATPLALSAAFIIEEGLDTEVLRREVAAMAGAARQADICIIAGDTKVVERGKGDELYIVTTGIGVANPLRMLGTDRVRPGDQILCSGTLGDHGVAILIARGNLDLEADVRSDTRALTEVVAALMEAAGDDLRFMRDPTRGGVGTVLNELARDSGLGVVLREEALPIRPVVHGACEILGIDPLYVANEGKLLAVVAPASATAALAAIQRTPGGEEASIIGEVREEPARMVLMHTQFGGTRMIDMLVGDPLPPDLLSGITVPADLGSDQLTERSRQDLLRRNAIFERFFRAEAARLAAASHEMSRRFLAGGRLLAFGQASAATDAQHVSVEFVHPVIVGKRALPALDLGMDFAARLPVILRPDDMVMGFAFGQPDHRVDAALEVARRHGAMTFGLASEQGEYRFELPDSDPFVCQEIFEVLYHLLWETVHVYFEHRQQGHDVGASSFLYPFLGEQKQEVEGVAAEVEASMVQKMQEVNALRAQAASSDSASIVEIALAVSRRLAGGGKLILFGNGGSATDANDLALDCVAPPAKLSPIPAISLAAESANITAIANDVGTDAIFARQLIAHGLERDVAVGISTSGSSPNILAALAEARKRGMLTVGIAGYDGGRVVSEGLADHALVVRSAYIPRIQEVQASLYHVLRHRIGEVSHA